MTINIWLVTQDIWYMTRTWNTSYCCASTYSNCAMINGELRGCQRNTKHLITVNIPILGYFDYLSCILSPSPSVLKDGEIKLIETGAAWMTLTSEALTYDIKHHFCPSLERFHKDLPMETTAEPCSFITCEISMHGERGSQCIMWLIKIREWPEHTQFIN